MSQRDAVEWRKSAEPSRDWIMIELKKWRRWIAGCCQWMLFILFRFSGVLFLTPQAWLRFCAIMHRAYCWVRLKLFIMMEKGYTTTQDDTLTFPPFLPPSSSSRSFVPAIWATQVGCVLSHICLHCAQGHTASPLVMANPDGRGARGRRRTTLLLSPSSVGKDLYLLYECDTTELTELALF